MNFDRLRRVAERADLGERKRRCSLAATIPERPGSFKAFASAIGRRNITEFNYRYSSKSEARVFRRRADGGTGRAAASYRVAALGRISDPRSKRQRDGQAPRSIHGRWACARCRERDSRIVSNFRATRRASAVLDGLALGWNISLFHYRNHGSDYGRVLVRMQVPSENAPRLEPTLPNSGYVFAENPRTPPTPCFWAYRP